MEVDKDVFYLNRYDNWMTARDTEPEEVMPESIKEVLDQLKEVSELKMYRMNGFDSLDIFGLYENDKDWYWYHCNHCSKTFHFPMRLKHPNGTVTEF